MNFINNWSRAVQLAAGATALDIDLENGSYVLTLTDNPDAPTRWEIVEALVEGGAATLVRGREATVDQDWPAGSVIFNSVTAGTLNALVRAGGVIVAEAPPGVSDIPPALGSRYIVPGYGAWEALGVQHGTDWVRTAGAERPASFTFTAASPGYQFQIPYEARAGRVGLFGTFAGTYPGTLVAPWAGMPHGLSITIYTENADAFALSIDFSAMGELVDLSAENYGVPGAQLSFDGGVVTLEVATNCTFSLVSLDREDGVFGLAFKLEPAASVTYLPD